MRKRAEWLFDDETGDWYCSNCHRTTEDRHDELAIFEGHKVIALCMPRYCGYCGRYMRRDKDGTV